MTDKISTILVMISLASIIWYSFLGYKYILEIERGKVIDSTGVKTTIRKLIIPSVLIGLTFGMALVIDRLSDPTPQPWNQYDERWAAIVMISCIIASPVVGIGGFLFVIVIAQERLKSKFRK